jgi:hypothetical protein
MESRHPTHVGYTVDEEGMNETGPVYLERNTKGNWVWFHRKPDEWDGETGITVYRNRQCHHLVKIRPVTAADLIAYWQQDLRSLKELHYSIQRNIQKTRRDYHGAKDQVRLYREMIAWTKDNLRDAELLENKDKQNKNKRID